MQAKGCNLTPRFITFEFAARGGGIALARSSMLAPEIERARLVCPFDLRAPLSEAFYLIAPEAGQDHPDAGKFRSWLIGAAKEDPENQKNQAAQRA
ncbi:hypothetical protein [Planktotalea arctica]|uniref:hypothetical protein n=1 Tax=Planktotalea arctica TaxID=1481893 RepID=UPI00111C5F71|nr:hypothetical protein [Planktotalea arctica]